MAGVPLPRAAPLPHGRFLFRRSRLADRRERLPARRWNTTRLTSLRPVLTKRSVPWTVPQRLCCQPHASCCALHAVSAMRRHRAPNSPAAVAHAVDADTVAYASPWACGRQRPCSHTALAPGGPAVRTGGALAPEWALTKEYGRGSGYCGNAMSRRCSRAHKHGVRWGYTKLAHFASGSLSLRCTCVPCAGTS